ncbi:MAG: hypothetical protein WBY53_06970 [Acidobacteriaceae bacterium]
MRTANGSQLGLRSDGTLASYKARGVSAAFRPNGSIASLHSATLSVARGPRGGRTIVLRQAGHGLVVSRGHNLGFVQKTLSYNGRTLIQRTYVGPQNSFTLTYSLFTYHNATFAHYDPQIIFSPDYYGWAYYPWSQPVSSALLWSDAILTGVANYFGYSPDYGSPADYLADYIISHHLQQAQQDLSDPDDGGPNGPDQ